MAYPSDGHCEKFYLNLLEAKSASNHLNNHTNLIAHSIMRCDGTHSIEWRRLPESNRGPRICNPLHSHSANAPS